jgi:hypothetical protein
VVVDAVHGAVDGRAPVDVHVDGRAAKSGDPTARLPGCRVLVGNPAKQRKRPCGHPLAHSARMLFKQVVLTLVAVQLVFTLAIWTLVSDRRVAALATPRSAVAAPPADELRVVEIGRGDLAALAARADGSLEATLGVAPGDRLLAATGDPRTADHLEITLGRGGHRVRIVVVIHDELAALPLAGAIFAPSSRR